MEKKFIKPNYKNCNLNISSTLAEFLGAENKNATLEVLKNELKKDYKNVVFICFDGMGIYPLTQNLREEDFLRKHIIQTLVSTFPSTTTNATTSLMTNTLPLEHGWFGWTINFPDMNKNIAIYLGQDGWTGENVEIKNSPLESINCYFDNTKTDYNINTIFPSYVKVKHEERNNVYYSQSEFFDTLKEICNREGKQFIYAYNDEPDHTMHDFGVKNSTSKNLIKTLSKNMEKLVENTKDTLFIITSDHGHIDVEDYIYIYQDKEIMDLLEIYPYLEPRATAYKVIKGKEKEFEEVFNKKYGKDFVLYKSEDLIKQGYFGDFGNKGFLLGDYISIGKYTNKCLILSPISSILKGHHTSLTDEMEVPLILINN
ncbi:MAG: alkaline phosphatase family protein [Clostridiales bacterium]|nr:alkaline phosphatase family protein [Clostridiales bacterium]